MSEDDGDAAEVAEEFLRGLLAAFGAQSEIERRVSEAAQILGLQNLLHRKPKQLSGGQRQRVALGRAIVREPQVFLMDEPLSNLDAKLRVQTRAELIKLHQRLQTTVIYVTHDQVEAMTMGSRIAVMRDGLLQQLDTPQMLYDNPANVFVAGFIGSPSMNFFNGTIAGNGNGSLHVEADSLRVEILADRRDQLRQYTGRDVVFGIRPEDIHHIAERPNAPESMRTKMQCEVVEPLGSELIVYLASGPNEFTSRMDTRNKIGPGDTLDVVVDTAKLHVFDKQTEQAII